jgi:hypothetical protein
LEEGFEATPSGLSACFAIPQIRYNSMVKKIGLDHGFRGEKDEGRFEIESPGMLLTHS